MMFLSACICVYLRILYFHLTVFPLASGARSRRATVAACQGHVLLRSGAESIGLAQRVDSSLAWRCSPWGDFGAGDSGRSSECLEAACRCKDRRLGRFPRRRNVSPEARELVVS